MPMIFNRSSKFRSFFNLESEEEKSNLAKCSVVPKSLLFLCAIINIIPSVDCFFNESNYDENVKISGKDFITYIYTVVNLIIIGYFYLLGEKLSFFTKIDEINRLYFNFYFFMKIKTDLDNLNILKDSKILLESLLTILCIINICTLIYVFNKILLNKNFMDSFSVFIFFGFVTITFNVYLKQYREFFFINNLFYLTVKLLPFPTIFFISKHIISSYNSQRISTKKMMEIQHNVNNFLLKFINKNNYEGLVILENQEMIKSSSSFFTNLFNSLKKTKFEEKNFNMIRPKSLFYSNKFNYLSDHENTAEKENNHFKNLKIKLKKNSSLYNREIEKGSKKLKNLSSQNLAKLDLFKRSQIDLEDIAEVRGEFEMSHMPTLKKRKKSNQTFNGFINIKNHKFQSNDKFTKQKCRKPLQSGEIKEIQPEEVFESLSFSHFQRKNNYKMDYFDNQETLYCKNAINSLEDAFSSKTNKSNLNKDVAISRKKLKYEEAEKPLCNNFRGIRSCFTHSNEIDRNKIDFNNKVLLSEDDLYAYNDLGEKLKLILMNYDTLRQKYSFLPPTENNSSEYNFVLFLNHLLSEIDKRQNFDEELCNLNLSIKNEENPYQKYGIIQISVSAKKIPNPGSDIIFLALRNESHSIEVEKLVDIEKDIKLITNENCSENNSQYDLMNSLRESKIISKNFSQLREERRKSIKSRLKSSEDNKSSTIILSMYNQKVSALLHDFKHVIYDLHLYNDFLFEKFQVPIEIDDKLLIETLKEYSYSLIQNITFFLKDRNNFLCGQDEDNIQDVDIFELVTNMTRIFNRRKLWEIESCKKLGVKSNRENLLIHHNFDTAIMNRFIKIKTNKNLFTSLLYNIMSNSFKVTKEGEICINLSFQSSSKILLSVIDTGPGIPDHILQNWAKPFNKGEKDGIGLGQYIMYTIAKNLNIEMPIPEKNIYGKGTITKLIIPLDCNIKSNLNLIKISDIAEYNYSNSNITNLWDYDFSPVNLDYKDMVAYNSSKTIQSSSEEEIFDCGKTFEILCLDDDPIVIGSIVNKVDSILKMKLKDIKFKFTICNDFKFLLFKLNDSLVKNVAYFIFILDLNISYYYNGIEVANTINSIYKKYFENIDFETNFLFVTEQPDSIKIRIDQIKNSLLSFCDKNVFSKAEPKLLAERIIEIVCSRVNR